MGSPTVPIRLDLVRDQHLRIDWADGTQSTYPIPLLRRLCPCAGCRALRAEQKRSRLTVLTGGQRQGPLTATDAALVGNYALRISFSDGHDTGIYSFDYLREIAPPSE
jgi:DUF971 family protein